MGCAPSRESARRENAVACSCFGAGCAPVCCGAAGQGPNTQAYDDASSAVPIPEGVAVYPHCTDTIIASDTTFDNRSNLVAYPHELISVCPASMLSM